MIDWTWEQLVAGEPRLLDFEQRIKQLVQDAKPGAYLPNLWYCYWGDDPKRATRVRTIGRGKKRDSRTESWNPEVDIMHLAMTSPFLRSAHGAVYVAEAHLRAILDPERSGPIAFNGRLSAQRPDSRPERQRPPKPEKIARVHVPKPKPEPRAKREYAHAEVTTQPGVYVIASPDGVYKIGMAKNIRNRVRSINTHVPFDLQITLVIQTDSAAGLERTLHSMFRHKCVKGEWFRLDATDFDRIKSVADASEGKI